VATVVLVGRPNVGKSSLFNRLLGRGPRSRFAVVADTPGVTRDLKEGWIEREGRRIRLVDTGGLGSGDPLEPKVRAKVEEAIRQADLVLFLVDGRSGVVPADQEIAELLRRHGVPVLVVATKVDEPQHEAFLGDLWSLGWGAPWPTSAVHARGIEELEDTLFSRVTAEESVEEASIRIAIIGRPNAGKSSLLNALLGQERVLVSEKPGTTRDSIDVELRYGDRSFVLIDTAGIRKRPETRVEELAIARAHTVIRESDVVFLVVDPFELGDRELKLAGEAFEAGRPVLLCISKWDRVAREQAREVRRALDQRLAHLAHLPRLYLSAHTGLNLHRLFSEAARLYDLARRRYETAELNRYLALWTARVALPNFRGRPLKLFYVTQPEVAPPTFVFFVNHPEFVTRAFEGYLRNRIEEELGLKEVPFRLVFRGRREEAAPASIAREES